MSEFKGTYGTQSNITKFLEGVHQRLLNFCPHIKPSSTNSQVFDMEMIMDCFDYDWEATLSQLVFPTGVSRTIINAEKAFILTAIAGRGSWDNYKITNFTTSFIKTSGLRDDVEGLFAFYPLNPAQSYEDYHHIPVIFQKKRGKWQSVINMKLYITENNYGPFYNRNTIRVLTSGNFHNDNYTALHVGSLQAMGYTSAALAPVTIPKSVGSRFVNDALSLGQGLMSKMFTGLERLAPYMEFPGNHVMSTPVNLQNMDGGVVDVCGLRILMQSSELGKSHNIAINTVLMGIQVMNRYCAMVLVSIAR